MKRNAPLNMIMQRGGAIFLLMILLSCNSGPDSHTVTFSLDGGYFPEGYETTITITEGSTLEGIPDPKKDSTYNYRYTFAGWYTDESFTDEYEYDTTLPVTSDLTLYAKWNRYSISHTKIYTVSFQSNGGTEVASQSVVNGSMAEEPAEPKLEGYFFDGWYSDANTSIPYYFNTPVTSSITLYAKWAKAWTVTFSLGLPTDINDKATIETENIYVKDGGTITFPKITIGDAPLSNIKFKDSNTGIEFNSNSPISTDLALTAFIDDYAIADDTYYVTTENGLNAWAEAVKNNTNLDCTLCDDIDLNSTSWTPIGTNYYTYTGTFDGGGYTITGLIVTGSNEYAGLFGRIGSGGTVKNVVLKDVHIESDNQYGCVGGVAGNSNGNIENCSVSGSVSGRHTAGGVVGLQYSGFITMCGSSVTVNGTAEVGGVAGKTDNSATLTACYATGNVTFERASTVNNFSCGVVGSNGSGILSACYATGNVTGTGEGTGSIYVGGVTGDNASGTLTACYHATGTVNGPDGATGGVSGRNYNASLGAPVITACYWGNNNQEQGIGYNQAGNDDTKKVEGLTTWEVALSKMNAELEKQNVPYKYADNPDDASQAPLILIDSTSLP